MTLTFCRLFSRIVTEGSFVKAAESMNMTASAVSHAVAEAEDQLGFRLFNRAKAGVSLTENGQQLYPKVLQLLGCEDALNQTVDDINGLRSGTINLGIFNSVCTNWMPEIFRRFEEHCPGIRINIYEGSYDDVIYWIKNGFVELGFLSTACTTDLWVEGRYVDPLVCIVPSDFPNREEGVIYLDEMEDQHFIIQREGSDVDVQTLFRENGLKYHTSCHVLDDTSIMAMIACGRGISIMPKLTAKGLEGELKVLRLRPERHRVIGLAALDLKLLSPAARRLYACINEYMDEQTIISEKTE